MRLTQTQAATLIASVLLCSLLAIMYIWKPQKAVFFPNARQSAIAPVQQTNPERTTAAHPAEAIERVDSSLGYRQTALGAVLSSMTTTQTPANLTPSYAVTGVTCDIVFDFKLLSSTADRAQYNMYVTNRGSGLCDDASLTLYYSDGERFISAAPVPQSGYYWKLGDLQSSEQRFLSLTTSGATILPSGTEGCATAHNGSDSCATATKVTIEPTVPPVTPTPTPIPTATPTAIATPTAVATSTPTPTPTALNTSGVRPVAQNKFYGVWVWDDVYKMSDAGITAIVNNSAAGGFDTIYLTIDKYLELNAISNTNTRAAALASYADSLSKFISLANAKGMQVFAEAGWKDWAENGKRTKSISILQYVKNYNATRQAKFAGVQYDIEPYLLSSYERNKATVLTNFVNHVAEIVAANQTINIPLEFVIPHFYDCAQKWTPNVTYAGKSDCTFNHLLTILDKSPNSTISIMAYRNFAEGDNGVLKLVQEELKQAQGKATKIVVAQETGDVDPAYVTYFGTDKTYMYGEFAKIVNAIGAMSSFGGMAVHYIDPFTALAD